MESRLRGVLNQLQIVRSDVAQSMRHALEAQKREFELRLRDHRARAATREARLISQLDVVGSSNKELREQVGQLDTLAKHLIQAAEVASEGLALEGKAKRGNKSARLTGAVASGKAAEPDTVEATLRLHLSTARDCIDEQREQLGSLQDQVKILRSSLSAVSEAIVQALMSELCLIDGRDR